MRILCVDDEPDIRALTVMALRLDPKMDVRDVGSADQALAVIATGLWIPDLFLLDVMMPGMSGTQLLVSLRDIESVAAIPAIFITARTNPSAMLEYNALDALGVIKKPFDVMTLANEVRSLMDD